MSKASNKFIMILFAFLLQLLHPYTLYNVVPFLIALACSFGVDITIKKYKFLPIILFLGCCFMFPTLICYLPVLFYDGIEEDNKRYMVLPFSLVLLLCSYQNISLLCLILFACFAAGILKYKYRSNQDLLETYKAQRDSTKELTLVMEERNHNLLMRQDYEVRLATLNERNRIAREIHDNVGHLLSSSLIQIGAIKAINQQSDLKDSLNLVQDTLNNAMNSIRESVHDLHEESFDLQLEIKKLFDQFTFCETCYLYDIEHSFHIDLSYHILSIVKEALNNVMKHSNATKVELILREQPRLYQLIIHDNGTKKANSQNGIGLRNMKQRIDLHHGYLHISNEHGFRIFITLPKPSGNMSRENLK